MLRSRISRRVIAEQHIHLAQRRPGFIGVIATDFSLREAVDHAARRTQQARARSGYACCCYTQKLATNGLDASARAGQQVRACFGHARCCHVQKLVYYGLNASAQPGRLHGNTIVWSISLTVEWRLSRHAR